jgi:arabinogalactan oligomer/maltooligosaccharide transport system substrate-binding protein
VGWVAQLASEHYLLNIDSYTPQHDLSDYLKAPLGYDEYGGHLYGLPQVTDFLALLYNKADLASAGIAGPPATMAGFEADAERIVRGRHQAAYGFETNGMSYFALPFLWAFGGGMLGPHEDILVNDPGSVAGLKFVLKLQNADKVMPQAPVQYGPRVAAEPSNMLNDFMSGRTAMIFDGPWDVSQILTGSAFAGRPGNLGIVGIPTGPDGRTGSPRGGQSYVISDGTAHPLEAYKFISFMSSTPSQVAIAKANHTLPTRWSAYRYAAAGNPVVSEFVSIDGTAVTRPAIPQGGHLFDAFDPAVGAALDGAESPADALNVVAAAWRQLLSG